MKKLLKYINKYSYMLLFLIIIFLVMFKTLVNMKDAYYKQNENISKWRIHNNLVELDVATEYDLEKILEFRDNKDYKAAINELKIYYESYIPKKNNFRGVKAATDHYLFRKYYINNVYLDDSNAITVEEPMRSVIDIEKDLKKNYMGIENYFSEKKIPFNGYIVTEKEDLFIDANKEESEYIKKKKQMYKNIANTTNYEYIEIKDSKYYYATDIHLNKNGGYYLNSLITESLKNKKNSFYKETLNENRDDEHLAGNDYVKSKYLFYGTDYRRILFYPLEFEQNYIYIWDEKKLGVKEVKIIGGEEVDSIYDYKILENPYYGYRGLKKSHVMKISTEAKSDKSILIIGNSYSWQQYPYFFNNYKNVYFATSLNSMHDFKNVMAKLEENQINYDEVLFIGSDRLMAN